LSYPRVNGKIMSLDSREFR